jgi:hypothetical protein
MKNLSVLDAKYSNGVNCLNFRPGEWSAEYMPHHTMITLRRLIGRERMSRLLRCRSNIAFGLYHSVQVASEENRRKPRERTRRRRAQLDSETLPGDSASSWSCLSRDGDDEG